MLFCMHVQSLDFPINTTDKEETWEATTSARARRFRQNHLCTQILGLRAPKVETLCYILKNG